uniref:Cell cycle checkpoint control protein n=1 Tax=Strigamia maritima TaxID=126957 RepID=T1J6J5_STRMM
MKYVIAGGVNIKVLGRIIHCLARIGDELYIESMENGMAFRTVNSARSAYACFILSKHLFETYSATPGDDPIKCKLNIKAVLPIFKNITSLEKTVEKCKIHLDLNSDRFIFQLHCKHDIIKTYNLYFIECEILQAVFNKSDNCNCIIGETKLFADAVQNFQGNQDEITLAVTNNKIVLRNYIEDEPDPTKVVHTEMILEPEEFSTYNINQAAEVTFCLKELRAVLSFTDPTNYDLSIFFENAGKPIVFSFTEGATSFEADFVLATISEQEKLTPVTNLTPEITKPKRKTKPRKFPTKQQATNSSKTSASIYSFNTSDIHSRPSTSRDNSRPQLGTLAERSPDSSPKTPPTKKVKSVFMTLLKTPHVQTITSQVLASDSDEDG